MGFYKHEGFRRLGIVFGCVGSIIWAILFTWKSWHMWPNVVQTRYEEYVSGSTPADLVAKRLDAEAAEVSAKDRWVFKFNPAGLTGVMLADADFRKLTRSDQVAVFEYLTGKYAAAGELFELINDEKAESTLEKRLGPRPTSEVRHDPNDPDPALRSDAFDNLFSSDPAASHVGHDDAASLAASADSILHDAGRTRSRVRYRVCHTVGPPSLGRLGHRGIPKPRVIIALLFCSRI